MKHHLGKFVYIASFILLIREIFSIGTKPEPRVSMFTKCALILMKPILLVNGKQSQIVIVLCFAQFIAIRYIFSKVSIKPKLLTTALLVYFTILQYFYRTSHNE